MWSFLWSRADAAEGDAGASTSASASVEDFVVVGEPDVEPAKEGAAEAAPEATKAEKPEEPAAAPAEPAPHREPTEDEIAAAKEELVGEAVDKILSAVGSDIIVNEVVTAPYDPRFPATNQARHCFVRYNEYYKCVFERGAEAERCAFYKRAYESMCPEEWVEEWEELREKGLWMGKY